MLVVNSLLLVMVPGFGAHLLHGLTAIVNGKKIIFRE